MTKYEKFQNKL